MGLLCPQCGERAVTPDTPVAKAIGPRLCPNGHTWTDSTNPAENESQALELLTRIRKERDALFDVAKAARYLTASYGTGSKTAFGTDGLVVIKSRFEILEATLDALTDDLAERLLPE